MKYQVITRGKYVKNTWNKHVSKTRDFTRNGINKITGNSRVFATRFTPVLHVCPTCPARDFPSWEGYLKEREAVASDNRVIASILSATVELDSGYILRL